MNCETCQELIHDLIDGSITQRDEFTLNTHLKECLDCDSVRQDLASIVNFSRTLREEYQAPPNEHALWLRIRNSIEAELPSRAAANTERRPSFFGRLLGHSWELSLPQLAASAAAIMLLVSLATVVGLRRWGGYAAPAAPPQEEASNINDRFWQRRQEIDKAIANSLEDLKRNPHDEVSEQMLNESFNDKLNLLKDFSDL